MVQHNLAFIVPHGLSVVPTEEVRPAREGGKNSHAGLARERLQDSVTFSALESYRSAEVAVLVLPLKSSIDFSKDCTKVLGSGNLILSVRML